MDDQWRPIALNPEQAMRETASMKKLIGIPLALLAGSLSQADADAATVAAGLLAAKPAQTSFTPAQLSHYAAALVDIELAGEAAAAQEARLPAAQRGALAHEARSETMLIVQRNDLDPATFNAISRAVEADPALRRKVHQTMMDKVLGT